MSYTILYRTAALKLSDGTFVPVGETGDNNVWECDNRRRFRSWSSCWSFFYHKLSYTEKEISDILDDVIERSVASNAGVKRSYEDHAYTREEVLSQFGSFEALSLHGQGACRLSAAQFKGWFLKGVRNAHTVEEFNKWTTVYVYAYGKDGEEKVCVDDEVKLRSAYDALKAKGLEPFVGFEYVGDYSYKYEICSQRQRQRRMPEKAFVVLLDGGAFDGRYVRKKTSRNLLLTWGEEYAHKYVSESAARRVAERLGRNGYGAKLKEISLKTEIL